MIIMRNSPARDCFCSWWSRIRPAPFLFKIFLAMLDYNSFLKLIRLQLMLLDFRKKSRIYGDLFDSRLESLLQSVNQVLFNDLHSR